MAAHIVKAAQKTLLSKLVGLDLRANHKKLRRATGQTGYIDKRHGRLDECRRFGGCVRAHCFFTYHVDSLKSKIAGCTALLKGNLKRNSKIKLTKED